MPTAIYTLDSYASLAETYVALWQATAPADRPPRAGDVVVAVHILEFFARTFPLGRARYHLLAGRWAGSRGKQRRRAQSAG